MYILLQAHRNTGYFGLLLICKSINVLFIASAVVIKPNTKHQISADMFWYGYNSKRDDGLAASRLELWQKQKTLVDAWFLVTGWCNENNISN